MNAQPINFDRQRPVYGLFDALIKSQHGSGNFSPTVPELFECADTRVWPVSLKAPTHCSARYIFAQQR